MSRKPLVYHVSFDGMSWPVPTIELLDRLTHNNTNGHAVGVAAASIIRAYTQMIHDPLAKRQRVIRRLRGAAPRPAPSARSRPRWSGMPRPGCGRTRR